VLAGMVNVPRIYLEPLPELAIHCTAASGKGAGAHNFPLLLGYAIQGSTLTQYSPVNFFPVYFHFRRRFNS
jgi:hypothetical protein